MKTVRFTLIFALLGLTSTLSARSIYLNGVDISSAQNQELKSVNITINENGDIFIIAPHYHVNEEDTYMPLSSLKKNKRLSRNINTPTHKQPRTISNHNVVGGIPTNATPVSPVISNKTGSKKIPKDNK